MSKEKAVFVHKVKVGHMSPSKARDTMIDYMHQCKIELEGVETKNVYVAVTDSDTTIECIYPVPNGGYSHVPDLMFSKVREVKSPIRGTADSAGIDFFIPSEFNSGSDYTMKPGDNVLIPSGIKVNVPTGYALIAFNKSGVATKKHLQTGACVVDEDYTGEVHIHMTNVGNEDITIKAGDKIVQFILLPVLYSTPVEVPFESLYIGKETDRGEGGFGSTDKK